MKQKVTLKKIWDELRIDTVDFTRLEAKYGRKAVPVKEILETIYRWNSSRYSYDDAADFLIFILNAKEYRAWEDGCDSQALRRYKNDRNQKRALRRLDIKTVERYTK